ncbi:MAG TPA: hypothetical protein VGR35_20745 [Tepidisphaeraceae bacterium]|nr:hypothetical protein [Tepidisphaeraceae bacterium]
MFKALVAASVAMLACCAAAAWGAPVPPTSDALVAAPAPALTSNRPSILHLIDAASQQEKAPTLLDSSVVNGFVPVSFSAASSTGAAPMAASAPDEPPLPDPAVRAAVIPLPTPLYAALALLAIALIARRALLRAC